MEIRHLRYFLAVAEELHFGRAAARIHIAQPPLSQQIKQLENEIGVPLFTRTKRSVQLTDAGKGFQRDAYAMLEALEKAVLKARAAGRGEMGRLSIGFIGSSLYGILPLVIEQFRKAFPDVELDLHEIRSSEQNQALRDRHINVSIARFPAPEADLVFEPIYQEHVAAALPRSHPFCKKKTIGLKDLSRQPFILFPQQPSAHASHTLRAFAGAGVEPQIVQTVGSMHTALGLVAAGIGVTLVPSSMEKTHREGVEFRAIAPKVPALELMMGYRADDTSTVLPHFIDIVRNIRRIG
jgi:DNA-binding transcriptional LysR family regulator